HPAKGVCNGQQSRRRPGRPLERFTPLARATFRCTSRAFRATVPSILQRSRSADAYRRAALVIAHPGHELRVHGWLEATRPITFVLTSGDTRDRRRLMASTAAVLDRAGARPGCVFGRLGDRDIMRALMHGDDRLLVELLEEIAVAFVTLDVDVVGRDAEEGIEP